MRKEILTHFISFVVLFLLIVLLKRYFEIKYLVFVLGGVIGTTLPDIDHVIYIYFLSPQELTSQRVMYGVSKGRILDAFKLMSETRSERKNLIFHSAFFQIMFIIFSFWILTSNGSLLGTGLVVSFLLHLLIDEILDLKILGNLQNWFVQGPIPLSLDTQKEKLYLALNGVILIIFSFLL